MVDDVKKVITFVLLVLCGNVLGQGSSPVFSKWGQSGDIVFNKRGDSIYLIVGDTIFVSPAGIYWDPDTVFSRSLLDSIVNGYVFIETTTSANWRERVSDETGSGLWVFGTSPTISQPTLTLKQGTSPTAEGLIEWHATNSVILVGTGGGDPQTKTFYPGISSGAYIDTAELHDTADVLRGEMSSGSGGWTDQDPYIILEVITDQVGIGTATPSEKLEVSGNISVSGTVDGKDVSTLTDLGQTIAGDELGTGLIDSITNGQTAYGWADHSAQGYVNSLIELYAYFDRDYFDTLIDASGDTIICIYSDSTDLSIFDTDDLSEGANKYDQALPDSAEWSKAYDSSQNLEANYRAKNVDIVDADIDSLDPDKLEQDAASTGQVLKWNGTAWQPGTDNTAGASADSAYVLTLNLGTYPIIKWLNDSTFIATDSTHYDTLVFMNNEGTWLIDGYPSDSSVGAERAVFADSAGSSADEKVQDKVGAMVDGGTETQITVEYDDGAAKLNFVLDDPVDSADGAERATKDADGNTISTTYMTRSGALAVTGNQNWGDQDIFNVERGDFDTVAVETLGVSEIFEIDGERFTGLKGTGLINDGGDLSVSLIVSDTVVDSSVAAARAWQLGDNLTPEHDTLLSSGTQVVIDDKLVVTGRIATGDNQAVVSDSGLFDVVAFIDKLIVGETDDTAYVFPTADGTNGQIMKTDGSGAVTWENESGGAGGGNPIRGDTGAVVTFDSLILTEGTGIDMTIAEGADDDDTITFATTLGTSVDLTSEVTGTLPVPNGGTGVVSLTPGSVLYGDGANEINNSGALQSGMLIIGDASKGYPKAAFLTEGEAIDVSNWAGGITISVEDATSANKGVATFSTDNFLVTSGDVTIKGGGVDLTTEVVGILPDSNLSDTVPFAHHTRISALWDFDLNSFTSDRATDSVLFDSTECGVSCGVHPDVEAIPNGWPTPSYDGDTLIYSHQLWMIQTPVDSLNCNEHPTLYCSDDKENWYVPFKVDTLNNIKIHASIPLNTPTGGISTDPQIIIAGDGDMYAYWRWAFAGESLYVNSSSNGIDWSDSTLLFTTSVNDKILSPAVLYDDDGYYRMWTIDQDSADNVVRMERATAPDGFEYTKTTLCTLSNVPTGWKTWHHNITKAGGLYVMVSTMKDAGGDFKNYLAKSYNGVNFTFSDSILTEGSGLSAAFDSDYVYTGDVVPRVTTDGYIFDYWYTGRRSSIDYWNIGYTTIEFPLAEIEDSLNSYFDTAAVVDTIQGVLTEGGYLTSESDPVWTSDSADYAFKTWVEAEIEDSLNEYSLTSAIASLYFDSAETVDTIETTIGPFIDTTTLDTIQNAHDAVHADLSDSTSGGAARAELADSAGAVYSGDVLMDTLSAPTYVTLEDWSDVSQSAMIISGGAITQDATDSTVIDIAAGTGIIKKTDSDIGENVFFDFSSGNDIAVTNTTELIVYVDYNGGSPIFGTTPAASITFTTQVALGRVYRTGNHMHLTQGGQNFTNFEVKNSYRIYEIYDLHRGTGLITSEGADASNDIDVSAGAFYLGNNRQTLSAIASFTDGIELWYGDGAGGFTAYDTTALNDVSYDDGDGTRASLTANRYNVFWIFMETDGDLIGLYDSVTQSGGYSLGAAEAKTVVTTLPPHVPSSAILVAKIIVQEGAGILSIEYPWAVTFAGALTADHGNLAGLGDDDHTQYLKESDTSAYALTILASPTLTGVATIPTPFTLGAVSVTPTGTELNFVDGVTSAIQTQLDNKDSAIVDFGSGSYKSSSAKAWSMKLGTNLSTTTPTDSSGIDTFTVSATGGNFVWQDSAGEPPFWVDSATYAATAGGVDPFIPGKLTVTGPIDRYGFRLAFDTAHPYCAHADTFLRLPADTNGITNPEDSFQMLHPSILYVPEGKWGYRYWFAGTPPNAGIMDEDVHILVSNDEVLWHDFFVGTESTTFNGRPIGFDDSTLHNPVYEASDFDSATYTSDPDIVWDENGDLFLVFRVTRSINGKNIQYLYSASTDDGLDWIDTVMIIDGYWNDGTPQAPDTFTLNLVSPGVTMRSAGDYLMYTTEDTGAAYTRVAWEAPRIDTTWDNAAGFDSTILYSGSNNPDSHRISIVHQTLPDGNMVWHTDEIIYSSDLIVNLVNSYSGVRNPRIYMGLSIDGEYFTTVSTPLLDTVNPADAWDHYTLYRSSGYFRDFGSEISLRLYYSATAADGDWYTGLTDVRFTRDWFVGDDTMYAIGSDDDTSMIIIDDDAGNVTWKVGTEDQTLTFLTDTVVISGDRIGDFAGTGLSVTAGVLNASGGGSGGLWDTVDNRDTTVLVGSSDTLLEVSDTAAYTMIETQNASGFLFKENISFKSTETVDGVDISILDTDIAGDSSSWNATADKFDTNYTQLTVGNILLSNDSISGLDVITPDTIVISADVITDFAGTNLSVTAGVLNAAGGSGAWTTAGDTAHLIDADNDTLAHFSDDDAGAITWTIGADQTSLTIGDPGMTTIDSVDVLGVATIDSLYVNGVSNFALTLTGDSAQFDGNVDIDSADINGVLDVTGNISCGGTVDTVDVGALAAKVHNEDLRHFGFTILDPNTVYDTDSLICIKPVTEKAITITRIDVTCDADPTTEPAMKLNHTDNFISRTTPTDIDVITTAVGVTTITTGFDDATIPASRCIYFAFTADPIAAIKSITVDIAYTID